MQNDDDDIEENDDDDPASGPVDDEIIADLEALLNDLVEDEHLELATKRGARALAGPLFTLLERKPKASVSDWLVDRIEVNELFLDEEELAGKLAAVKARIRGKVAPTKSHPELAAKIIASPDDEQAWSVYADWLQEQGDPRGELMAMQLRRGAKKDPALLEKERSLIQRQRRHFYGDLATEGALDEGVEIDLRYGFFENARLLQSNNDDLRFTLGTVIALESGRFLRTLLIKTESLDGLVEVVQKRPLPKTLRSIDLKAGGDNGYPLRAGSIDVGSFVKGVEHLEEIHVAGNEIRVAPFEGAPNLRRLFIKAMELHLEKEAFANVSKLTELRIDTAKLTGTSALVKLLESKIHDSLEALVIANVTSVKDSSAILQAVVKSPGARRLRELAFRNCGLRDKDVELIIDNRESFQSLQALDLRRNKVLPTMRSRIEAVWPKAFETAAPREPSDDDDVDADEDDDDRYDDIDE